MRDGKIEERKELQKFTLDQHMVDCTSFIDSLPQGKWSTCMCIYNFSVLLIIIILFLDITKENFELLAGAAYLDSNTLIVKVGNEYEELGSGLFVMQTLLNHSCNDNVEIIAAGTLRAKIEIEANRDIKQKKLKQKKNNKNCFSY